MYSLVNVYLSSNFTDTSIHIGSISISVLSGKIMFRDILLNTVDFSLHISDGYAIISWWKIFKDGNLKTETG